MEVSTEELAEKFRSRVADGYFELDGKKTVEGDIQHFWQSWEEWSARGPGMGVDSTDGFADWPLEGGSK